MQQSLSIAHLVECIYDSEGILRSAGSVLPQCPYGSAYLPCMQVIILFLWPWFASNTRDLVDGDLPALLTARAEGYEALEKR